MVIPRCCNPSPAPANVRPSNRSFVDDSCPSVRPYPHHDRPKPAGGSKATVPRCCRRDSCAVRGAVLLRQCVKLSKLSNVERWRGVGTRNENRMPATEAHTSSTRLTYCSLARMRPSSPCSNRSNSQRSVGHGVQGYTMPWFRDIDMPSGGAHLTFAFSPFLCS